MRRKGPVVLEGVVGPSWSRRLLYAGVALTTLALLGAGLALVRWHSPATTVGAPDGAAPGLSAPGLSPSPPSATPTPTPAATTTVAPRPPPATTAPAGGKPGPANTGVPDGVSLRVVDGDQTYNRDGQVVSGLDIHGYVRIRAKNVTIKNSVVRGGPARCNAAVIQIDDDASAAIMDVEIRPTSPNPCLDGIAATNATLVRLDVHGVVDGVKAYDNVTLRDSYIHDLSRFASDPNQGGGATHNDAVQTYEGNTNVVLRHNTLDAGRDGNAAYQVTQDGGKRSTNLRVEHNWLDGGGCTLNFSHNGGPAPMTGIYVIGNRFGRGSFYRCPILLSTQTTLTQLSGNVWDDTGAPIPPPQRHD